MNHFVTRYVLCLMLLNLAACSTMQTVSVEDAMRTSHPRGIDYGSLVKVKMLDNRTLKFRVTEISPEGLGDSEGFYRYENMKSLYVETPAANSRDTTLNVILGALGIAALIALIANADSVSVCSSPPCPQ